MYSLAKYFEEAQVDVIPPWFSEIPVQHPVYEEPLQPRWHQVTGLNLAFASMRSALYDEQGTGKTLISQGFCIWQAAVDNGCICLMPPVLLGQYRDSLLGSFPGIDKHVKIEIYRGDKKKRKKLMASWANDNWPGIVLMSYEMFRKEHMLFSHYEALVMDEARPIGNPDNKTSQAIEQFMGNFGDKYAMIMNGTPARTDLSGLYGYVKFISPEIYRSRMHFNTKHIVFKKLRVTVDAERMRDVQVIDHFVNTEELYANLYHNARRVEKQEVMELPLKNLIPYKFELEEDHYDLYRQFVEQKLLVFEDNTILDGINSSALRNSAMQAVIHTDMLQLKSESAVFAAIDAILEGLDLDKTKVFLLGHYRKTIEALAERYSNYNPAVIYGGTGNNEKEKDKFLKDPSCRMAIANYESGGVGLNLQDVCHTAIVVEPTGVTGAFDQAVDRLHRSGQKRQVNIYLLMPKGTVYISVVASMTKRRAQIRGVVSALQVKNELLGGLQEERPLDPHIDEYDFHSDGPLTEEKEDARVEGKEVASKKEVVAVGWEQL